MGATERVKEYLSYKGVSKYKFYQVTGFSNKFLDNSSNMGTDRAEIIIRHYPDLNVTWLITGKGEMLRSDNVIYSENHTKGNSEVKESKAPYRCASCDEKNRMIQVLLSANERLEIENKGLRKTK
jgi:hypothetical protein